MTFKPKSKEYYDSLMERTRAAAAIRSRRAAQGAETTRKEAWEPKVGDRVRINEGPYEGIEATIVKLHGDSALLDMGDVETDSHYGKHRWMLSRVRLRVSLVLPCAPDPTPSPAIEAARERVCAEFLKLLTPDGNLKLAVQPYSNAYPAVAALVALRALLTPPPPPPPPDPVAELREAAKALIKVAWDASDAMPAELNAERNAMADAACRLRSALAAMEART